MTFIGGETPAMRLLAGQLESIGRRLVELEKSIETELDCLQWHGADAERYRTTWSSNYAKTMQGAAADLGNAAGDIRSDAVRQERASGSA